MVASKSTNFLTTPQILPKPSKKSLENLFSIETSSKTQKQLLEIPSSFKIDMLTKDSGKITKEMGKANNFGKMGQSIRGIGKII